MSKAANTARLKRMHANAKKIQRKSGGSYRVALKKAGAMEKGKKVSGVRRISPKKRTPVPTKRQVSRARPKRKSSVGSVASTKSKLRMQLNEQLAWELLARESAHRVRDKKKKQKKITAIKRELRAIGGLKHRR
jgi:hypothetical protein